MQTVSTTPINDFPVEEMTAFYHSQAIEKVTEFFDMFSGVEVTETLEEVFQLSLTSPEIHTYADCLHNRYHTIRMVNDLIKNLELMLHTQPNLQTAISE